MNARERLDFELAQCHAECSRISERAPLIGKAYMHRRLLQLDRRFPRHGWGWQSKTLWCSGLHVIPAVWGEHDADKVAVLAMKKLGHRLQPFEGIRSIALELNTVAHRIQREFGWGIAGQALSQRAAEWDVRLGQLSPDPFANRLKSRRVYPAVVEDVKS